MASDEQRQLNDLLRWSIMNSDAGTLAQQSQSTQETPSQPRDPADLEHLRRALFSQPSEASLIKQEMDAVKSKDKSLEDRVTAFDNFQMILEKLDNANNLTPLKLWEPLLEELENEEEELRMMAAWCISTAVQNNKRTQDELVKTGALSRLTAMALGDPAPSVRKKAALSLSSAVRNCPEALDEVLPALPDTVKPVGRSDIKADDMDALNEMFKKLRDLVA